MRSPILRVAALFLLLSAFSLLSSGCGRHRVEPSELAPAGPARNLLTAAYSQIGAPYCPGGSSPATGFDCSGFTCWVFSRQGVSLPRRSGDQFLAGREVDSDRLQPGDLVFFDTSRKGASHVGIYSGRGAFIHCPDTGGRVREDRLADKYWKIRYLGARRILP